MPSTERPLHILILSDRDWTHPQGGGTGTNLFGQVSRWMAWGHRVSVIACSYPGAAGACVGAGVAVGVGVDWPPKGSWYCSSPAP